jgi:hypothetical protein
VTLSQLRTICNDHALKVEPFAAPAEGTSRFRDLVVGVGAATRDLCLLLRSLLANGLRCDAGVTYVDNPEHPDHMKPYLSIRSFWVA